MTTSPGSTGGSHDPPIPFAPPPQFNIADYFLDDRIGEGLAGKEALRAEGRSLTYGDVRALANRFGHLLRDAGVLPEERVIVALPDGADFVGALFGTLKIGAVVVMVNPHLRPDDLRYLLAYTRARAALAHRETADALREAAATEGRRHLRRILALGEGPVEAELEGAPEELEHFPTHRDDPAIWLFSGGTTGRPKAVVQTHTSFANTTECYARRVVRYAPDDVTLSVPKLYFGYATGSNLFFPFAAGATAVLFPDRCTPEVLFEQIARHRPTILVNVPTMIQRMVDHPSAPEQDLSSLRLATSAGEALAVELHRRWMERFGVELLDGLGTAEMWHIFVSNRPGRVRPGTLGEEVPGFEVRVTDRDGMPLPDGEAGILRVRGNSRAVQYWQRMEETRKAFHGEWYVSGDMVSRSADGYFTYHGRADDMLKVSGKWLAPGEVENRLLQHPAVREAAVVGVPNRDGLVEPHAYVLLAGDRDEGNDERGPEGLGGELRDFVREGLASYKVPSRIHVLEELPRTHLGKVDRAALRARATE